MQPLREEMPLTVCLSGTQEAGGPNSPTLRTLASPPGLSPSGSVTCHITPCSLGSSTEEEKCGSRRSAKFSPAPTCSQSLVPLRSGSGHARPGGPEGRLRSECAGAQEAVLLCFSWEQNPLLFL